MRGTTFLELGCRVQGRYIGVSIGKMIYRVARVEHSGLRRLLGFLIMVVCIINIIVFVQRDAAISVVLRIQSALNPKLGIAGYQRLGTAEDGRYSVKVWG